MNIIRKIESYIKPVYIVGFFVFLLLVGLYREVRAETSVELGPTFLSGQFSEGAYLGLNERFNDYTVGVGYVSEQWVTPRSEGRTFVHEAVFLHGYRNVSLSQKFSLGFGVAYYNMRNERSRALGSPFNFVLRVQYQLADNWSVNVHHNSNAGSVRPNMGQDMLAIAYHFR